MAGCWPVDEGGAGRVCTFTIALEALAGQERGDLPFSLFPGYLSPSRVSRTALYYHQANPLIPNFRTIVAFSKWFRARIR